MPLIDLSELRRIVDQLDLLDRLAHAAGHDDLRRLEDLRYTLCVYVGLRDPHLALARARQLLATRAPA